jgi:hypothetical protein
MKELLSKNFIKMRSLFNNVKFKLYYISNFIPIEIIARYMAKFSFYLDES